MAQTGYTPIKIYASSTASAVPLAANLSNVNGAELAINIADGKLYYKNSSGVVTLLASSPVVSGAVIGPASSTDTAVALFDGTTGKLLKNSSVTVDSSGDMTISTNSSTNALRITQTGSGNALLVEDSANPDSTPFVINQGGDVIRGATTLYTSVAGTTPANSSLQTHGTALGTSSIGQFSWGSTPYLLLNKSSGTTIGDYTAVPNNTSLGGVQFNGSDGTSFIDAAQIVAFTDGTPATGSMPGRLTFYTTPNGSATAVEAMRITSAQNLSLGASAASAGTAFRLSKNITGSTSSYGILANGTIQSDVTSQANLFESNVSTAAASFTLTNLRHFYTAQGTIGAGSSVTNQFGFNVESGLTGATNNYGFYGNIASTSGAWNLYMAGTAANYMAGKTRIGTSATPTVSLEIGATDAMLVPSGSTAQQPTGVAGYFRFNSTNNQFEGYNGTSWGSFSNTTGTVTSVAQTFTGGLISVAGSPITGSGTLALTVAGTSGGVPYFSSSSTWATSAALASNALVVGGGAGAAPATVTTGTGVVTALGVNTGSAGAFVVNGGALGTPSSGTVTNLTGTASININGTVGATTANTGAFTTLTASADSSFTSTGALLISKGTTGQQPGSPAVGMIRYNTTNNAFEGYSGASPTWNSIGGATLSNDTTTSTFEYPVFASTTSGSASTLYTSNAKYLYKPSTGELQSPTVTATNGIFVNSQTMTTSQTIAAGTSGFTIGPFSQATGAVLTVSSGARHVII